jgi:hypothetical protein
MLQNGVVGYTDRFLPWWGVFTFSDLTHID